MTNKIISYEEIMLRENAGKGVGLWESVVRPSVVRGNIDLVRPQIDGVVRDFNYAGESVNLKENRIHTHYNIVMTYLDGISKNVLDFSKNDNRAFIVGAVNRHTDEIENLLSGCEYYESFRKR